MHKNLLHYSMAGLFGASVAMFGTSSLANATPVQNGNYYESVELLKPKDSNPGIIYADPSVEYANPVDHIWVLGEYTEPINLGSLEKSINLGLLEEFNPYEEIVFPKSDSPGNLSKAFAGIDSQEPLQTKDIAQKVENSATSTRLCLPKFLRSLCCASGENELDEEALELTSLVSPVLSTEQIFKVENISGPIKKPDNILKLSDTKFPEHLQSQKTIKLVQDGKSTVLPIFVTQPSNERGQSKHDAEQSWSSVTVVDMNFIPATNGSEFFEQFPNLKEIKNYAPVPDNNGNKPVLPTHLRVSYDSPERAIEYMSDKYFK